MRGIIVGKTRTSENQKRMLPQCLKAACVGSCFLLLSNCSLKNTHSSGWQDIFDGQTLTGWTPKISGEALGRDERKTFQAQDGILSVNYDQYAAFDNKFGHLFFEHELSSYQLKLDYRFIGEQASGGPGWAHLNSGLMIHTQSPSSMGVMQPFPVSVEAQFLAAFDDVPDRTTANVCTPGTHVVIDGALVKDHCINSKVVAPKAGEWVRFMADVQGNGVVKLYINDELAFELSELQLDSEDKDARALAREKPMLSSGYIALQAESHPIEFRNIKLLDRSQSQRSQKGGD